jgi:Flagellar biosynthesis protein, FliO
MATPTSQSSTARANGTAPAGLGAWLTAWLRTGGWRLGRSGAKQPPRLAVVERIPLAPRPQLALIEADGQRLLVALNSDGTPAFYPLAARKGVAEAAAAAARRVTC